MRADSGSCRPQALRRFECWGADYVIGLQKNAALLQRMALAELYLADAYKTATPSSASSASQLWDQDLGL